MDEFCYQGDMLFADGDADAAVEAINQIGWNKFGQLVPDKGPHACVFFVRYRRRFIFFVRCRDAVYLFSAVGWVAGRASGL